MISLECDNVSVSYCLYNHEARSIRRKIINVTTGGVIARDARGTATITALEGVFINLSEGDRLGLTGHNGAGKTTLLRTLAGIFKPTKGKVISNGRISTLFSLGAGVDQDLSGYENIDRMCALTGIRSNLRERIKKDVEEFADLGDFLKMPVRTYSAGMAVRLMFAVATSSNPEILLIDEVFGVGDADFQERAKARIEDLLRNAGIVVMSTHSMDLINKYCNNKIELEHGKIKSYEKIADSGRSGDW